MATKSRSTSPVGFTSMALIILVMAASFSARNVLSSGVAARCAGGCVSCANAANVRGGTAKAMRRRTPKTAAPRPGLRNRSIVGIPSGVRVRMLCKQLDGVVTRGGAFYSGVGDDFCAPWIHVSVSPRPSFPRYRRTAPTKRWFASRKPAAIRACPTMLGSSHVSGSKFLVAKNVRPRAGEPARRQHPHHRVHEALSDLRRARRGLPGLGSRRQRLHRLHQQFHLADSRPCPSRADQGRDRATRAGIGVRDADGIRGRSRRIAGLAAAVGRSGAVLPIPAPKP